MLTTTYTNSTEGAALDALRDLGADVRVSYDVTGTRLHAKSWLFHRESGFSTAYIGSSNLTHSAQVTGLEWNVRVSGARNPDVVDKVAAVFESYWNSGDFIPYDADVFAQQTARADEDNVTFVMSPIELRPEPFQERLLEEIALSRERGYHRNLLASATGTGKTVMAAIDYARLVVGTTSATVRQKHSPSLQIGEVSAVLADGVQSALHDRDTFERWRSTSVSAEDFANWVDGPVADSWGPLAAARVHSISTTGFDGKPVRPLRPGPPHTWVLTRGGPVPGTDASRRDGYEIAQVLAWVAAQRGDVAQRLQWRGQIRTLMSHLVPAQA